MTLKKRRLGILEFERGSTRFELCGELASEDAVFLSQDILINEYFNIILPSVPECAAVQSSPSVTEIKNEWRYFSNI